MPQSDEVVVCLMLFGLVAFCAAERERLRVVPHRRVMLGSLFVLFLASLLTIVEGYYAPQALNFAEHIAYALSGCLLSLWVYRALVREQFAQ